MDAKVKIVYSQGQILNTTTEKHLEIIRNCIRQTQNCSKVAPMLSKASCSAWLHFPFPPQHRTLSHSEHSCSELETTAGPAAATSLMVFS